jgi:hypothetical protein
MYSDFGLADLSIKEICKKMHMAYSTYTGWTLSKGFNEWFSNEWVKVMQNSVYQLDKIGIQQGKKNFKYWEVMQVKYGGYSKVPMAQSNVVVMVKDYNDVEVSDVHP